MIEFDVPDMSCGHCVSRITQALKQADPACEVQVDLPHHKVQVQSRENRAVLADALAKAGYAPA